MKILVETGIFPPDIGGPATYVAQFAAECPRYGHTVAVVAYGESGNAYFVSRAWPPFFRHALFFIACIRAGYSADVIFAQGAVSAGVPAAFAALILRKILIVRVAGDFAWEYARNKGLFTGLISDFQKTDLLPYILRFARFVQRRVCMASAYVIVPSEYLKGIVCGWGIPMEKIAVIHNAVSTPLSLRAPHKKHPVCIFSAGRLVSWKGFSSLIRVFASLSRDFPHTILVIAGDGPCRDNFLAEARLQGVAGRVRFLGVISQKAMTEWYSKASCFVLFSDYEGLSHVLLEALSYKVPVIASDAGGNGELISPSINGMLVPCGDEHALEFALRAYLRNPQKEIPLPGFLGTYDFKYESMMQKIISLMESKK